MTPELEAALRAGGPLDHELCKLARNRWELAIEALDMIGTWSGNVPRVRQLIADRIARVARAERVQGVKVR